MFVDPNLFVSAMSQHWRSTLQNAVSAPLRAVWHQMAMTFNRQISHVVKGGGDEWQVIQPPTGTGKTQGLAMYCSLLPADEHPGVLIVTRLKAQADEIVETINSMAGRPLAIARHGDNAVALADLRSHPVLVITHKAFENGLDAVSRASAGVDSWNSYRAWQDGVRRLVVIDEALDVAQEGQVTLDAVRSAEGNVPFEVRERFPAQMDVLRRMVEALENVAREEGQRQDVSRERILDDSVFDQLSATSLLPLRTELRERRRRSSLSHHGGVRRAQYLADCERTLRDVETVVTGWRWFARKKGDYSINTARLIVPPDAGGAVVMDATATPNLVYELFEDRVRINPCPLGARRYDNVTLHLSFGHTVGKSKLTERGDREVPRLVENLRRKLSSDRKVLLCCHKGVKSNFDGLDTGFAAFDVAHWGAIDGQNVWQDRDAVVIFGLPYRDKTWSANTFMAFQGVQPTEWLNAEGNRPFRNYADIRQALEIGQLVVSVVQAINRVRCRRVIDENGNCAPTDVYIALPDNIIGRGVAHGISEQMPGIRVEDWSYEGAKRGSKSSAHSESLVTFAARMPKGRAEIKEIARQLDVPKRSMDWLRQRLRDGGSELCCRLKALGVSYEAGGRGRGSQSFLVKA